MSNLQVPMDAFNGGGGASLNFDVKAYATEAELLAATPKENTIGLITTTAINGWVFSAVEPAEPVEGMVWFGTGTSSTCEFNALKKNVLQVYPISAKQCVDGVLVSVAACSYQGGAWVSWIPYLYKDGNLFEDITGGWTTEGVKAYSSSILTTAAPSVTNTDTYLQVTATTKRYRFNKYEKYCA